MPFTGSINAKLRSFFFTHANLLSGHRLFIGCSGNFTIEQIITRVAPTAKIHSNDVSLYSSVIGHALTTRPFPLRVTNPELEWMNRYMEEIPGVRSISAMLLFMEMLKYEKRKNEYSTRMWESYILNWTSLLDKTQKRVTDALEHTRIASYTETDVHDYYPCPDASDIAVGFLPTYVGGYEKLFSRLEASFDWPHPSYQLLTEERREETVRRMTVTDYVLYDDHPRDLPCVARVDLFGHRTVYVYSSLSLKPGVFRKTINEKVAAYDILGTDEEISLDTRITVKEVPLPVINHYRNMFLSKKIEPGSGGPCYLVFAKEKLFGFLIFQPYSRRNKKGQMYLLSDFVVSSTRYRRLAKLLLLVTQCGDMQTILSERTLSTYRTILTTAFTNQPVSMKYRGVYELVKRGKGFLNYQTAFTNTTFEEVIGTWMKKYGKQ
jgi:hypothetical protein